MKPTSCLARSLRQSMGHRPSSLTRSFHASICPRVRLGDTAPNFTAETTEGTLDFHQWLDKSWGILFSHPADFTPVCTTELGMVEKLKPEFEKRNCKVIGLSCDPLSDHKKWESDIIETQGLSCSKLSYPIIADQSRLIAKEYDMLDDSNIDAAGLPLTVRSVFVIGPDKQVKLMITYPASTGRNFDELLRVIDSLQLTADYKVATPVNWTDGDDCVIVPSVSNEEADTRFPKGYKAIRPYLRMTPQPNK